MNDVDRFSGKYSIDDDGCWVWHGAVSDNGYASFWNGQKAEGAHRWSYKFFIGPIPEGLDLDHLCRNRTCVNPSHLEPVSRGENIARGARGALRSVPSHCKMGHSLKENGAFHSDRRRTPRCKVCEKERAQRKRDARDADDHRPNS